MYLFNSLRLKRAAVILITFILVGCGGSVQAPSSLLDVEPTVVDLGKLEWHAKAKGVFVVQNLSSEALELELGEPSCGCIGAWAEPTKLVAGGQGKVFLELDTEHRAGGGIVEGNLLLGAKGREEYHRLSVAGFLEGFAGAMPTTYVVRPAQLRNGKFPPLRFGLAVLDSKTRVRITSITAHNTEAKATPGPINPCIRVVTEGVRMDDPIAVSSRIGTSFIFNVEVPVRVSEVRKSQAGTFIINYRLGDRASRAFVKFILLAPETDDL